MIFTSERKFLRFKDIGASDRLAPIFYGEEVFLVDLLTFDGGKPGGNGRFGKGKVNRLFTESGVKFADCPNVILGVGHDGNFHDSFGR